jgi:lipopolysaccharide/colanic/teichoic acid biosynthesis glycosyltransferase
VTATAPSVAVSRVTRTPTIWGCTPQQAHDRYWAALGVQVVRRNEPSEIVEGAELFLLCEQGTLVFFHLAELLETIYWLGPSLLALRVRDAGTRKYREVAVTDKDQLVRFERVYRDARMRSTRVALTSDPEIARNWQNTPDSLSPWRTLRAGIPRDRRHARAAKGRIYDEHDDAQLMECVRDMMRTWPRPDTTIPRAQRLRGGAVADPSARVADGVVFLGPVWIGAGRRVDAGTHVVGPAVLWDDPASRPALDEVRWIDIEPGTRGARRVQIARGREVPGKRVFDVVFAAAALLLVLPLFPLVALAILLEDGRPIFFAHRRETVGGREFPCLKFRSMRKQADVIKEQLKRANEADGPQFFMENDPRVTRVGRILRKLQVDELPQLVNVLLGHMSIVGPRPSPHSENQYCPSWREARLSVRPGLTGLWQVSRTRQKGLDFQEWIRFDVEYVENASWLLDLKILWKTVRVVVDGLIK